MQTLPLSPAARRARIIRRLTLGASALVIGGLVLVTVGNVARAVMATAARNTAYREAAIAYCAEAAAATAAPALDRMADAALKGDDAARDALDAAHAGFLAQCEDLVDDRARELAGER
jgi:hypothetical protein